jgi:hypothetical protein
VRLVQADEAIAKAGREGLRVADATLLGISIGCLRIAVGAVAGFLVLAVIAVQIQLFRGRSHDSSQKPR